MFMNGFQDIKDLAYQFRIEESSIADYRILLAVYTFWSYEGQAFVLYEFQGQLYEVNGSHCSCYGLEGQWGPEEVNEEQLFHRVLAGRLGQVDDTEDCFADELLEIITQRTGKFLLP